MTLFVMLINTPTAVVSSSPRYVSELNMTSAINFLVVKCFSWAAAATLVNVEVHYVCNPLHETTVMQTENSQPVRYLKGIVMSHTHRNFSILIFLRKSRPEITIDPTPTQRIYISRTACYLKFN